MTTCLPTCDRCEAPASHYDHKADENLCTKHWLETVKDREQVERRG